MSNAAAFKMMEEWKKKVETLPKELIDDAGEEMAAALDKEIKSTAGAGQTPEGKAWKEKKAGGRALPNVSQAIKVVYYDREIVAVARFPYSLHHWGKARRSPKRQILPENIRLLQGVLTRPLRYAFKKHFAK